MDSEYLVSPRRKLLTPLAEELTHKKHRHDDDLAVETLDVDDGGKYLFWLECLLLAVEATRFFGYLMFDFVPVDDGQWDEYNQKLAGCHQMCREHSVDNQYLNQVLYDAVCVKTVFTSELASENLENIKMYYHHRLTPFYLLDLETKFVLNPKVMLQFLHQLDNLNRVYTYTFRESPSNELKINWIMNGINKNYLVNKPIIDEVQAEWFNINKDPLLIRQILIKSLYYYK